ncbi:diguanylate cyclase [Clostridium yunnanense]|nr:diguanylate cyclase [Clostridium yunnanense]
MQSINNFLLIGSSMILCAIAVYCLFHRKMPGAFPLLIQMIAATLWVIGSYLEIHTKGLEAKILWRNVQQIGVFIVPISSVLFAVDYSQQTERLKKYVYILAGIPITSLVLILTNRFHNIMRTGFTIKDNSITGQSLEVHSTMIGSILLTINFFIPILAIVILIEYRKRLSKHYKKQILLIILSISLTLFLSWVKSAFIDGSGIYIPVAVLYIPSSIILFYCVFRYNFFRLSPVARDKVFDIISEGILVVNQRGIVVDKNPYAETLIKKYFSVNSEIIGASVFDVFINKLEVQQLLLKKAERTIEVKLNYKENSGYLLCSSHPLSMGDNEVVGTVIVLSDITEKKLYEIDLLVRAERDWLTQLLNRQGFNSASHRVLKKANVENKPVSCLMLDVDYFKKINDTYGHANGDRVLQNLAKILDATLRKEDIIGRIGGEEFAVIMIGIDKKNALIIAEKIRKGVEESSLASIDGDTINYTVSIGIADNSNSDMSQEKLLRMADIALYKAKETLRNTIIIYNE